MRYVDIYYFNVILWLYITKMDHIMRFHCVDVVRRACNFSLRDRGNFAAYIKNVFQHIIHTQKYVDNEKLNICIFTHFIRGN